MEARKTEVFQSQNFAHAQMKYHLGGVVSDDFHAISEKYICKPPFRQ